MSTQFPPLKLIKNTRYPNFQLYAVAGQGKPPETTLVIAVLETCSWLRKRFRELEVPLELLLPEPTEYASTDCTAFQSFAVDTGYKLEVIWLQAEKSWTLQLIEPDLGPQPGEQIQTRPPVPGRLIETNIAYRIVHDHVECGFCTMVSEPSGTTSPCEVYRHSVIKSLARNPRVGLRQGWPLLDAPHSITTVNEIKELNLWLKDWDRMLPAVISTVQEPHPTNGFLPYSPLVNPDVMKLDLKLVRSNPAHRISLADKAEPALPAPRRFDVAGLARYKMGYAQFFLVDNDKLEAFQTVTGYTLGEGDVLLWEPIAFGGEWKRYTFQQLKDDAWALLKQIEETIQYYPQKKPMTFGKTLFLPEARMLDKDRILSLYRSKEEMLQTFLAKTQAMQDSFKDQVRRMEQILVEKEAKIQRLHEQIQGFELKNLSCVSK